MSAVREFALAAPKPADADARAPVLQARRVTRRPSLQEVMADTEKRFAKTLAYLAR